MRSKVKTGDVIQIRKNGPNYITLGKVVDNEGVEHLATTKNGNVTLSGRLKAGSANKKPRIHIVKGSDVKRVHGNRSINMESVISQDRRLGRHLRRTTASNGVITGATNIMAQIRDLAAEI